MKHVLLALVASVCLSSCVVYADPEYSSGCFTFCDDYGCREVCNTQYYYYGGEAYYWDAHFGCWIGPHGYWRSGAYYYGFHPGYHEFYHHGYYHGGGHYYGGHGGYHGHGGHR
jgi:hypothetical protein